MATKKAAKGRRAKVPATVVTLGEVDFGDELANQLLAAQSRDPGVRCKEMIANLRNAANVMADATSPAPTRAQAVAYVARMWSSHINESPSQNAGAEMIREALDVAASVYGSGRFPREARDAFVQMVEMRRPESLADLKADVLACIESTIGVWDRGAGRPKAGESAPTKWEAFARLHEAMGFGSLDADYARSLARRKTYTTNRVRGRP